MYIQVLGQLENMTDPGRSLKVFVSGDVCGNVNTLFKRIDSIQAKMGAFDMLFCVGNFFGKDMQQWLSYKNGDRKVPVTTYILGKINCAYCDSFAAL